METPRIALAPRLDLSLVPSTSIRSLSISCWRVAEKPISFGAMTSVTFATACRTPLPPYRFGSPSRSSRASWAPVDAPEGTDALARAPPRSSTKAFNVGLPRKVENFHGADRRNSTVHSLSPLWAEQANSAFFKRPINRARLRESASRSDDVRGNVDNGSAQPSELASSRARPTLVNPRLITKRGQNASVRQILFRYMAGPEAAAPSHVDRGKAASAAQFCRRQTPERRDACAAYRD